MQPEQRGLVYIHRQAQHESHAYAHAQWLVHAPEHQHQRQKVRHPGNAPERQHVQQQGGHQTAQDEQRIGRQQQLLARAHDHRVFPFFFAASAALSGSGRGGRSATVGLTTITLRAL